MANLPGDSYNYEILRQAASSIKNVPGAVCEIGTRLGGSLKHIVDGLISVNDLNRNIVCVDPYGNIDYVHHETQVVKLDYTNTMRNTALKNIYEYVEHLPVNVVLMCMEDTEFFKRFSDGVPFYQENKKIETTYSLVFFDGPHSTAPILNEVEFFKSRVASGSIFVFDDIETYPHQIVEDQLLSIGFAIYNKGNRKASYINK